MEKTIIKIFDLKKTSSIVVTWAKAKKWWILTLIVVGIFIIWQLGAIPGLLWLLFLSFLVFEWDNRIIALFALGFLVSCPFLLIFKKEVLAEQSAVYAYYFLVITVILQLIEYTVHPKKFSANEKDNNI